MRPGVLGHVRLGHVLPKPDGRVLRDRDRLYPSKPLVRPGAREGGPGIMFVKRKIFMVACLKPSHGMSVAEACC